jgi:hypothetical protein
VLVLLRAIPLGRLAGFPGSGVTGDLVARLVAAAGG